MISVQILAGEKIWNLDLRVWRLAELPLVVRSLLFLKMFDIHMVQTILNFIIGGEELETWRPLVTVVLRTQVW